MYTNQSIYKKINFIGVSALLFMLISATLYIKTYIPPEYYSPDAAFRTVVLSAQSVGYGLLFAHSGGNANQLAFAGTNSSSVGATSTIQASSYAVDVPVLLYHGIVTKPDRYNMTAQTFSNQMLALKQAGYQTITLNDFYQFMNGTKKLPDKSFLLTFDDGRMDSYQGADPVLNALGFHAVMFVPTGDILHKKVLPGSYYLDEVALHAMIDSGRWELGSLGIQANTAGGEIPIDSAGTQGNFLSNKMWLADSGRLETDEEYITRVSNELVGSKADLQNTLGVPITTFAYPFSDYGQESRNNSRAVSIINEALKQNYTLAFQQVWPVDNTFMSNYQNTDDYHIRRIESGTDWTGQQLVHVLGDIRAKTLPITDSFSGNTGWNGTWGNVSVSDSALHLSATATTSGAFAYLEGTGGLSDYAFVATMQWNSGKAVSLFSRFTDGDDTASCTFNQDSVRIDQKIGGVDTVLTTVANPVTLPARSMVAVSVFGTMMQCYEGSRLVASAHLPTQLNNGGVALQVWNSTVGSANVSFSKVQIIPNSQASSILHSLPSY